MTLLADPVSVVTNEMTFQERCDVLSGSLYHYDDSPDYFDHDEPGDFVGYPDVFGFIGPDECHDLHGPDDCGVYCVSRRDAGVMPHGIGVGDSDIYENAVAVQRTGSDHRVRRAGQRCCSYARAGWAGWSR